MTTEVTPDRSPGLVRLGPDLSAIVPIDTIRCVEVVTYRPIADYGFWGIRSGRDGERALIARGNRGVRLELTDGSKLLIGSQQPERWLASTLAATGCALQAWSVVRHSPRPGIGDAHSLEINVSR